MVKFVKRTLAILALMLPTALSAVNIMYHKYEVEHGLSHNTVRCILQDREGFMWFGTADGLNRFDGKNYKIFPSDNATPGKSDLGNNSIFSLDQDDDGNIWVGTSRGAYIYDPEKENFQKFETRTKGGTLLNERVRCLLFDSPGRMWFGTTGQGLFIYDTKADTLFQTMKYGAVISSISRAASGIIYVGTMDGRISEFDTDGHFLREIVHDPDNGEPCNINITSIYNDKNSIYCGVGIACLQVIDKKSGAVKTYHPEDIHFTGSVFRKIFPMNEEKLLIATDNGMLLFNIPTGKFEIVDSENQFGINDQSVFDAFRDREGGVWIATEYGGVDYIPRNIMPFSHVLPMSGSKTFGGSIVSAFAEDTDGGIWVGTRDGGVVYYNSKQGTLNFHKNTRKIRQTKNNNIRSLLLDGDRLWIGTASRGIEVLHTSTGKTESYQHVNDAHNTISDNSVTALFKDREGAIYVGTSFGLNIYRPQTNDFLRVEKPGNQVGISDIIEDSRGNMWYATSNSGLYRMKRADASWVNYTFKPDDAASLSNNRVTVLFEDDNGVIWIGTENGLCKFDYGTGSIERIDPERTILPSTMISAIEQDKNGDLWISSSGGIFCIDPEKTKVTSHFTKEDGLQSNLFNTGASLTASDGKIYFGGINGFIWLDSQNLESNDYVPAVIITDISANNLSLPGEKRIAASLVEGNKGKPRSIKLTHDNNNIAIDFVALSYQSPLKNKYSYILEGWDEEWTQAANSTTAVYNNLPPGDYTFRVRGANNDGTWNEQASTIKFTILPPFYLSAGAYIIYMLIMVGLIALVYTLVDNMQKRKLQEYAKEQDKLSYHSQIDFFTNVAHEIRTPLTLIKVPLEFIIASGEGSPQVKNYLEMISTNASNLLNLINQLLDFRKSGESQYELTITREEMRQLIREICARFNPVVNIGNLTMEIDVPDHDIYFNVDTEAFTKIANNLISNAIKYAERKIRVSLRLNGHMLEFSVADDGKGVNMEERDKIFDSFYQPEGSKAGSGIGLHLAKLLTEKHGGTISVATIPNAGAVFTVSLPLLEAQSAVIADASSDIIGTSAESAESHRGIEAGGGKDRLLLVEDNEQLRTITGRFLEMFYDVRYADNGQSAIEILDRDSIDIIVTDLMMPEMDGYELCEFVKSDIRYSHIPVIQLTAKTSLEDKIKGLEYGSDAYIEKPFSLEHLNSQIANLLENRRRLRKAYDTPPSVKTENAPTAVYAKKDSEFIEKLNAEIDKFIQLEDISLDHLAESMFMSRSNFYRKIKWLFGVSPNEYVKRYRLKRAAAIISRNECRISDVYVKVGFNSASYFTKCFKKFYGVLPKDYAASLNNPPAKETAKE